MHVLCTDTLDNNIKARSPSFLPSLVNITTEVSRMKWEQQQCPITYCCSHGRLSPTVRLLSLSVMHVCLLIHLLLSGTLLLLHISSE
jgi:hypothetical protein